MQLALGVCDLDGSVAFYSTLFGVEPAKRSPGYTNFTITDPPLKLVLLEGEADQPTVLDHLGVEVATTKQITAATQRFTNTGLATFEKNDTSCRTPDEYAVDSAQAPQQAISAAGFR